MFAYRFTSLTCLLLLLFLNSSVASQDDAKKNREQIGEVLGKPVYRDEIRTVKDTPLRDELQRLFGSPVMQKYREKHKAEIEPTNEEIDAVTVVFDRKHQERIKPEEPALREQLKAAEEQLAKKAELTKEKRQEIELEKARTRSKTDSAIRKSEAPESCGPATGPVSHLDVAPPGTHHCTGSQSFPPVRGPVT
jgi:outer membrane protein assembly factor BamE (lipoprotein component of BamABCDE complex)